MGSALLPIGDCGRSALPLVQVPASGTVTAAQLESGQEALSPQAASGSGSGCGSGWGTGSGSG